MAMLMAVLFDILILFYFGSKLEMLDILAECFAAKNKKAPAGTGREPARRAAKAKRRRSRAAA